MSMELSNYDPNEPDSRGDNMYVHAYNGMLSGLILTELDQIRQSADALSESGFPLSDELEDEARDLENLLLDGDKHGYRTQLHEVLESTIRSYAYSGLPLDSGVVLMACDFYDISKRELKWILEPKHVLGMLAEEGLDRDERSEIRYYGKKAMRELGVGSWVTRLAALVRATT